jgi:hypothetical protein
MNIDGVVRVPKIVVRDKHGGCFYG